MINMCHSKHGIRGRVSPRPQPRMVHARAPMDRFFPQPEKQICPKNHQCDQLCPLCKPFIHRVHARYIPHGAGEGGRQGDAGPHCPLPQLDLLSLGVDGDALGLRAAFRVRLIWVVSRSYSLTSEPSFLMGSRVWLSEAFSVSFCSTPASGCK